MLERDPALGQRPIVPRLFEIAARQGHRAVADVLVEYGTLWSVTAAVALGRLDRLEAMRVVDPSFLQAARPLILAAHVDRVDAMEWLLDHGADIDRRAESGSTALHQAVESQSMQALECLLSRGARVRIRDGEGETPISLTNWPGGRQQRKIRQLLVAHGANPED